MSVADPAAKYAGISRDGLILYLIEKVIDVSGSAALDKNYLLDVTRDVVAAVDGKVPSAVLPSYSSLGFRK